MNLYDIHLYIYSHHHDIVVMYQIFSLIMLLFLIFVVVIKVEILCSSYNIDIRKNKDESSLCNCKAS